MIEEFYVSEEQLSADLNKAAYERWNHQNKQPDLREDSVPFAAHSMRKGLEVSCPRTKALPEEHV